MSKIPTENLCPECIKHGKEFKLKESSGVKFCDGMHCKYVEGSFKDMFRSKVYKKKNELNN